jgi:hypothetical protein
VSDNVGVGLLESGMVEYVGLGVGISTICHSRPEVLPVSSWLFPFPVVGEHQAMSVASPWVGMVENMGLGVGISTISHSRPEICKYFRFQLFISISGRRRVSGNVGTGLLESGMVENMGLGVGIPTISHSRSEICKYFRFQLAISASR